MSREMPNHRVAHFTGDAKSQSRTFHGRCQITGSHISREMPNHRVAHFTGDAKSQSRAFHGRCQITGSHISREIGKLQDWSFIGRSTNCRIGRFTGDARLFPHCQMLFIVHFFESLHGRLSNHRVAHFTGDRQITGLVIYWTINKSQDWAFHGGCSALPSLSNAFHCSFF